MANSASYCSWAMLLFANQAVWYKIVTWTRLVTAAKVQVGTILIPEHIRVTTRPDHRSPGCQAVNSVLTRIGDKWSVLIIVLLGDGPSVSTRSRNWWVGYPSACRP